MPRFDRVAKWGKTRPLIINLPLPAFIRADVSPRTEIRQPSLLHSCHFFFRSAFPPRRRHVAAAASGFRSAPTAHRLMDFYRARCTFPSRVILFVTAFFLRECVKKERERERRSFILSCRTRRRRKRRKMLKEKSRRFSQRETRSGNRD